LVGTRRSDKRDVKQLALLKEYQKVDHLLRWTNLRLTVTAGVGVVGFIHSCYCHSRNNDASLSMLLLLSTLLVGIINDTKSSML
jgi:hypothetical protein